MQEKTKFLSDNACRVFFLVTQNRIKRVEFAKRRLDKNAISWIQLARDRTLKSATINLRILLGRTH